MYKLNSLNGLGNPAEKYLNEKEAFKYMVEILKMESPRMTKRCSQELEFFYNAFRNKGGLFDTKSIQFCDILALSYIKIKYPFLIDFFLKTIDLPLEKTGVNWYLLADKFKDKEAYLTDWVTEVTGRSLNDFEKFRIKELIGLVAYQYVTVKNKNYNVEVKETYHHRTSDWISLNNALALISDNVENQFEKYYDLYTQHKLDKGIIHHLENKQLLEYSRFFIDIRSSEQDQHIDIAAELVNRLKQKKIAIRPITTEDTLYQEAVYQLTLQLLYAIEKDTNQQSASVNLKLLFGLMDSFLKSSNVSIKAKYILLNSFTNNERGSGSEIHSRLTQAFDKLMKFFKNDILPLIKCAFDDADKRYFDGKKVIYKYEENFFYVLYQSWSGKADQHKEIKKIRRAASRGIYRYPDAIKLYWSRYPYDPKWQSFDDLLKDHSFFSGDGNSDLYMPLHSLIKITKKANLADDDLSQKVVFWEKVLKHESKRYKKIYSLRDDPVTLKAILIKRNLY